MNMAELNPWGNDLVDYEKLFARFGLQHMSPELQKKLFKNRLIRRGIVFAHRDLDRFVKTAESGKPVALLTGIKPSSVFHLGSKMTAEELIFFQKEFDAKTFYGIADLEAYADNGLPLEEGHRFAIDNVADLLALGLEEKNAVIYKQSQNKEVLKLSHLFAKKTTLATLEALYGPQNLGLYFAVLTQAADILFPMEKEFGGARAVLVPVGADQDPHIRLARDLAAKFEKEGFVLPSASYHQFFRSLNGETKMSKRDPDNVLTLNDSPADIERKVKRALTGGRNTEAEQRKLGGEVDKCVVYELMKFHFYEDDGDLKEMRQDCLSGKILCGECKFKRIAHIQKTVAAHQAKKKKLLPKAEKLVEQASQ